MAPSRSRLRHRGVTESERALADSDLALLAALRERVEVWHQAVADPSGDRMDETEVEGLAVLVAEWTAKAESPDPAVQAERRAIRGRIEAFRQAARAQGLGV